MSGEAKAITVTRVQAVGTELCVDLKLSDVMVCDEAPGFDPRMPLLPEPILSSPRKPTVPEVMPLVQAYCAEHPSGGSLHIVLEDLNVSDEDVAWCQQYAKEQGDEAGAELAGVLLRMSKTQRRKLGRLPRR